MALKLPLRKIFHRHVPGTPRFALTLSWPMVGALSLILAVCVGWSFFMGYMVGKGQNPEAELEAMTGLKITRDAPETPQDEIEVLPEPNLEKREASAEGEPYPFNRPDDGEAWQGGEGAAKAAGASPVKEARKPAREKAQTARPKSAQGQRYDYVFQIAAYRSLADAERLRATLEKRGQKTNVVKSGKVHLVTARLRGDEQDVKKLEARLASLKLGKPMQLSRKPVEAKKGARSGK